MKKLLLAIAFLFFAGFTHASTLTGKIVDPKNDNKTLELVKVTLGIGDSANSVVSKDKGFKFTDFTLVNGLKIKFEHPDSAKYYSTAGQIIMESGTPFIYLKSEGRDQNFPKQEIIKVGEDYTLNAELLPIIPIVEIIRGTITATKDGVPEEIAKENLSVIIEGLGSENFPEPVISMSDDIERGYTYVIHGHLGTDEIPRNYRVGFVYTPYKTVYRDFEVRDKIIDKDTKNSKVNVLFDIPTGTKLRENNMSDLTGFGCNEFMPKYLVGANCVDNSVLKGDASDIA